MRLDHVSREIICKVVYCGPGLSGKTTNLQYIHERAPKNAVGQMVSIDTESDRTLHFDLLPLDLGTVQGFKCRFEFYTVPGQTYYGATRRMVLEGADGIVFVADSRREMLDENVDALNDLFENLHHHGLPSDLPMVVQYNKQDLPESLSAEQLNPLLNPRGVPWFAASAKNGENVLETMKKVTTLVIDEVGRTQDLGGGEAAAPQPAAVEPTGVEQTWILTCHNCQSLLEVPSAKRGDIFTCGSCRAPLEVADPDKGMTRAPVSGPTPRVKKTPQPVEDHTGSFPMGSEAPSGQSALSVDPSGISQVLPNQPFALEGFTAVARLDESLLGQRYRVRDSASGRFLRALSLNPQPLRQPGYMNALEPALSMANQVNHKGILKLVGLRRQGDQSIILTADAPDHQPLSHVLARRTQLNVAQALRVIQEIALALDEAARHGVTHGWLRPDVILLNAEGSILIDELGLPKPHAYLLRDSMGASAATEHYLAPEHLVNDSPSDVRTDIFQMGALLFRMLTGEGLVTGYSAHEALHKVSASGCRQVRSVVADVSREIDSFCAKLTAIERKDRYQSHREVLGAMERLAHHLRRGGTMNLTQGAVRPGSGTGAIRRSGTGAIRRSGTGSVNRGGTGSMRRGGTRPLDGGTGTVRRTSTGTRPLDHTPRGGHPQLPRKKSGGGGLVVIIIILVIGAAAVAVYAMQNKGSAYQPFGSPPQNATPSPSPEPAPTPAPPPDDGAPQPPDQSVGTSPAALVTDAETKVAAYVGSPDPQLLGPAQVALERIREINRPKWAALRNALNAAMPVDSPTPAPVIPPVVDGTDPAPVQDPAPDAEPRRLNPEQITEIEGLIEQQRFKAATDRVTELVADDHGRQGWLSEIANRHRDARAALQRAAMKATTEDEARTLLEPAIGTWQMDGDQAWADALISAAGNRTQDAPAPNVGQPELPTVDPAATDVPTTSPNGFDLAALRADARIDDALAIGDLDSAERALRQLDESLIEVAAIQHKVQLWGRRAGILSQVIASRSPRMGAVPPIAKEPWDVVGAAPQHLILAQPGGAKMNLAWTQVRREDLGKIFSDAAASQDSTPTEIALAAVGSIISRQAGSATLAVNRANKVQYEGARQLQLLLDMFRERQVVALLDAADAAVASNDPVELTKVIAELSRGDRLENPAVAAKVEELKQLEAKIKAGGTGSGSPGSTATGTGKDHLTFDDPADRLAFGERTGAWSVAGGAISNNGDGALTRTDCGNAQALVVAFTPAKTEGGFTIDFRGIRLVMDFTTQSYLITSQDQRVAPKQFPFLANTQYVIYLAMASDGTATIQINQADPVAIQAGQLNSKLALVADTGAAVIIDEVELRRGSDTPPGTSAPIAAGIDPAQQQILREALGIEPLGGGYKDKDSQAIILPRLAGVQSGIAVPIREGMKGVTFKVAGQDAVSVGVGTVVADNGTAEGPFYEIPLPIETDPPLTITVTWTAKHFLVQIEQEGAQPSTHEVQLPDNRTHVFLRSSLQARVLTTPKILR